MTPERFFANPPWAGGHGGIRMGLKPIPETEWLTERPTDTELETKLRLLREHRHRVLRFESGSQYGQREALAAVATAIGARVGPNVDEAPIETAALLIPDDLCLMQLRGASYHLTAACVCAPSYWDLGDKIGRPLADIHDRVPSLNDRIGAQMQRFFAALPASQVFERRNWSIHPTNEPFQPDYDGWARTATFDRLFVRSERQTLRRLSTESVLFTIRVTVLPLTDIQRFPSAAADMLLAIERLSPVDRENVALDRYVETLRATLSNP